MRKRKRIRTQREGSTSASSALLRRDLVDSEELERYEDRLKTFHEQRYKEFLETEQLKLELKAKAVLANFATEPPEKGEKRELSRRRVRAAIALVREAQEQRAQQDPLMGSEPDDDFDDSKPDWKTSLQFAKMLLKMQGIKPDRLHYLSKREFEKEQKELVMCINFRYFRQTATGFSDGRTSAAWSKLGGRNLVAPWSARKTGLRAAAVIVCPGTR